MKKYVTKRMRTRQIKNAMCYLSAAVVIGACCFVFGYSISTAIILFKGE